MLLGKLRKAICQATNREGGGCVLPDDQYTKTGKTFAEFLWDKHPDTRVPLTENTTCAAFKEYEALPKRVSLNFMEDDVIWVASKISSAVGVLVVEAIDLSNSFDLDACWRS